ncbi:hypothetical protein D5086_023050 [Populus alba]|uniref:Uncharacterized protein n=1 Tax=Populus alba TaxID=43335 RepID=A0ACC4B8N7_POPAL
MESSSMNNTVGKDDDLLVDTAEAEALKKRISSHPLYGLLVQTHIDCLKEAYCFALSKLKEAMEEPQQETVAFINSMHLQLKELTRTHSKSTAEHSTSTTSSGERID